MSDALGLHLLQGLDLVASPRRSAVARLDAEGRLTALDLAGADDEVLALLAVDGTAVAGRRRPPRGADESGRRDVEARARLVRRGRLPGVAPAAGAPCTAAPGASTSRPRSRARAGLCVEALPDLVLRQIAWERDHPPDAPALDLAEYRAAWIGVRAPVYRPKGTGRARPAGDPRRLAPARRRDRPRRLGARAPGRRLGRHRRRRPHRRPLLRLRRAADDAAAPALSRSGPAAGLQLAMPADANLRERVAATLARLRAEGAISI